MGGTKTEKMLKNVFYGTQNRGILISTVDFAATSVITQVTRMAEQTAPY